jgi:hypothetical protein
MGNVLSKERREQVIALGRLGWSLRRIEQATGVRRETAGDYLRVAGVALRAPGGWGHHSAAKPAIEVTTDSGAGSEAQDSKPAIRVTADSGGSRAANDSKPAIGVTTGFLKGEAASGPAAKPSVSACEPYRELIGLEIERGRNATGVFQLCRDRHSWKNAERSTMPSSGRLARNFVRQTPISRGILRSPLN